MKGSSKESRGERIRSDSLCSFLGQIINVAPCSLLFKIVKQLYEREFSIVDRISFKFDYASFLA